MRCLEVHKDHSRHDEVTDRSPFILSGRVEGLFVKAKENHQWFKQLMTHPNAAFHHHFLFALWYPITHPFCESTVPPKVGDKLRNEREQVERFLMSLHCGYDSLGEA